MILTSNQRVIYDILLFVLMSSTNVIRGLFSQFFIYQELFFPQDVKKDIFEFRSWVVFWENLTRERAWPAPPFNLSPELQLQSWKGYEMFFLKKMWGKKLCHRHYLEILRSSGDIKFFLKKFFFWISGGKKKNPKKLNISRNTQNFEGPHHTWFFSPLFF